MKRCCALWLMCLTLVVPFLLAADRDVKQSGTPTQLFALSLKDTSGRDVALAQFKSNKAIVAVFTGTECPVNNLYMRRLKELHEEFAGKGVQFLAINSNSQDDAQRVAEHAKTHGLPFPVLKDSDHRAADILKAERTPEAIVIDPTGAVQYRGRIDDQYGIGYQRPQANHRDLANALDQLLIGKPIAKARTDVSGCVIGRAKKAEATATITYTKQIARIMQKNCQECHRPGQIAPFSLMTYEKARGWAESIREVVTDGRMPPWHADPQHGKWANDRRLSDRDKQTLLAWIDQGCPKGDQKDLPPPKNWVEGWVIGKPDAVFTMEEEVKVPAKAPKNGVPYKYFTVPTNFKEDVWVQAAEARPGNRAVVHHIIVFIAGADQSGGGDPLGKAHLVGTAPGDMPLILPPGVAKKVPKGSKLVFQMHYTPNGVEQTDRSSVGLVFAKEPPKHVARTRAVASRWFAIPPGDGNHKVESKTTFQKDAILLSFMPHMHVRGKSFEYRVIYPDGRKEVLLSVPRYDFGWQSTYRFQEPKRLPAGTRMECTAHFDNSEANLNNPDPTKTVKWGDQTWEEMMIGWVNCYYVDEKPAGEKTAKATD